MIRTLTAAILASAALLGTTGASAQIADGFYVATPATAPAKTKLMTRDTAWNLRGGAFVAAESPMRATVVCQLAAREMGGLTGFTVDGNTFDAAALDACNAKAGIPRVTMAKSDTAPATAN